MQETKFIFSTKETIHYRFPTHANNLVMDRADAETSEVFVAVLEPGEGPPRKYYALSVAGQAMCVELNREFRRLVGLVDAAGQDIGSNPKVQEMKRIVIGNQDHE